MIEGNVDILIVTETKLDSTFPTSQFYKNGFTIEMMEGFLFTFAKICLVRDWNHLPNDIKCSLGH